MNPVSQHQDVFISFVKKAQKKCSVEPSQASGLKSKVVDRYYCNKCRFSSRDHIQFRKHVLQHEEMTFSCSYCSHVSYTKGESQRHLVLHTGTFPFRCQFCDYGAIRNDYIIKHTERVHKYFGERLYGVKNKALALKNIPPIPSKACLSDFSSKTRVLPRSEDNNANKMVQKGTIGSMLQDNGLAKVQVELLAPLNEPIQHDRPLTVSYPPELSIPPGCFVELVEVKTVNGTKELELKLVPQQSTEEDKPEKASENRTRESAVQNVEVAKASFRCSLVSQAEVPVFPSPCTQKHHVQQKDSFPLTKHMASVPLMECSKETLTVKEEPEEHEIEVGGKTQSVIPTNKNQILRESGRTCERERMSLNLMKLENPIAKLNNKSVIEDVSPKSLPAATAVGKLLSPMCKKPPVPTLSPQPADNSHVKQKDDCPSISNPFVSPVADTAGEDLPTGDISSHRELPIISSVFSLRSCSEDLAPCVTWDRTKSELHPQSMSLPMESLPVQASAPATDQGLGISGASLHDSPSQNIESKKNLAGTDKISKSQGNAQDSQPVFIPRGSVLRVSNLNSQSSALPTTKESHTEGNWLPRPVLSSGMTEESVSKVNAVVQGTGLKLSLKRRRSGAENNSHWQQQELMSDEGQDHVWKLSKHKKKRKKHKKASKVKALSQGPKVRQKDRSSEWLTPLKADQPVHFPSPNQPVVVLNHPRPHAFGGTSNVCGVRDLKRSCSSALCSTQVPCEAMQTQCLLKMKLKKVNKKRYEVVGFIYRDAATKPLKC
ncbi:zinc finger protein 518B isoform X1 [Arapaima gigas]